MSDNSVDPSGNTEAFKAFTSAAPEETPAVSKTPWIIAGVLIAIIAVVLLAWLTGRA